MVAGPASDVVPDVVPDVVLDVVLDVVPDVKVDVVPDVLLDVVLDVAVVIAARTPKYTHRFRQCDETKMQTKNNVVSVVDEKVTGNSTLHASHLASTLLLVRFC